MNIAYQDVSDALARILPYINTTPLFSSSQLDECLGHQLLFKAECFQKTGAFKARGGCNALARLAQDQKPIRKVVANSSGNHAQAVAWAARQFGLNATIYMPRQVSPVKAQATQAYGAETVFCDNRVETDQQVEEAARARGVSWIPPYNHNDVIAGQGTAALQALEETGPVDAVVAPCGGGGLLSGTLIATRQLCPGAQVIGAEPAQANDAARSIRAGSIQTLSQSPDTLADGARTLAVGELTFEYLKQLDGFYEVDEASIIYWTQWLTHLLKIHVEPTSAMAMGAVTQWLATQTQPKRVLVILSGGNIDRQANAQIWEEDCLTDLPSLN